MYCTFDTKIYLKYTYQYEFLSLSLIYNKLFVYLTLTAIYFNIVFINIILLLLTFYVYGSLRSARVRCLILGSSTLQWKYEMVLLNFRLNFYHVGRWSDYDQLRTLYFYSRILTSTYISLFHSVQYNLVENYCKKYFKLISKLEKWFRRISFFANCIKGFLICSC